jgi:hypothetical protein
VPQRPHVVETVGEFHNYDPPVVCHGHEHRPQILRLLIFLGVGGLAQLRAHQLRQLTYLGLSLDQRAHLVPEARLDLAQPEQRVLDGVVEQAGGERGQVHVATR